MCTVVHCTVYYEDICVKTSLELDITFSHIYIFLDILVQCTTYIVLCTWGTNKQKYKNG